jgi:hypothetical protein
VTQVSALTGGNPALCVTLKARQLQPGQLWIFLER